MRNKDYKICNGGLVPPDFPRVRLQVRIINGEPLLFTENGIYIEGQCDLTLHAPMQDLLKCTADVLLPEVEEGLPKGWGDVG